MAKSYRNGKSARGATSESTSQKAAQLTPSEMTTECLAAAVEAELSRVETQLSRLAADNHDARPYESFDINSCFFATDHSSAFFEYDGHCPPQPPGVARASASQSYSFSPDDYNPAADSESITLVNRVATLEGIGTSDKTGSELTDDLQNTFQQLGRLFSSEAAKQWRQANERLSEVRSLSEEIRRLHAAARDLLGEIEQLRVAAGRALSQA